MSEPEERVSLNLEESGVLCHMLLQSIMDLEKEEKGRPLQFTQRMRVLYLKLTAANDKLRGH